MIGRGVVISLPVDNALQSFEDLQERLTNEFGAIVENSKMKTQIDLMYKKMVNNNNNNMNMNMNNNNINSHQLIKLQTIDNDMYLIFDGTVMATTTDMNNIINDTNLFQNKRSVQTEGVQYKLGDFCVYIARFSAINMKQRLLICLTYLPCDDIPKTQRLMMEMVNMITCHHFDHLQTVSFKKYGLSEQTYSKRHWALEFAMSSLSM